MHSLPIRTLNIFLNITRSLLLPPALGSVEQSVVGPVGVLSAVYWARFQRWSNE